MRFVAGVARTALLVCLLGAAGGCRPKETQEGTRSGRSAPADTGAMGGLTPEQIRARAEPMSPARAESLGIVDTSIHVEAMDSTEIITRSTKPLSSDSPDPAPRPAPRP